jgi:hypothetical protein
MAAKVNTVIFYRSETNPHFRDNYFSVQNESCLKATNILKPSKLFIVAPEPRRFTTLLSNQRVNIETRRIEWDKINFNSTELWKRKARNKALIRGEIIDSAINSGEFWASFVTLTMPQVNRSITEFIKLYKQNAQRKGIKIVYHFWVLEFGKTGHHAHYHITFVMEGKKPDEIPLDLFPDKFWNQKFDFKDKEIKVRTEIQIVAKSVYRYMTKYFTKSVNEYCINHRNTGFSTLYSNITLSRIIKWQKKLESVEL